MSDSLVPSAYLAIPELMLIDHRRQDGDLVAPPMRRDFYLRGPMGLKGDLPMFALALSDMPLTIGGLSMGFGGSNP